MNYQLIWPSAPLRPYIQFYGRLKTQGQNQQQVEDLIPPYLGKGIIFSLEERPLARIYNHQFDIAPTDGYFMPQCTNSWHMQINGKLNMLGVFFRPGMFRHFFDIPARELTDRVLTFADVGIPDLIELQEHLLASGNFWEKVQRIELYLEKRLVQVRFRPTLTDQFLSLLDYQAPDVTIKTLSHKLGRSNRYVRKVFQQDIGIAPKTFLKIRRFNVAFNLMKANQFFKISDIAYRLNYFDQSHFIKEFRHFTGVTPLQFMKQEHPLLTQIYWREKRGA